MPHHIIIYQKQQVNIINITDIKTSLHTKFYTSWKNMNNSNQKLNNKKNAPNQTTDHGFLTSSHQNFLNSRNKKIFQNYMFYNWKTCLSIKSKILNKPCKTYTVCII